MTNFDSLRAGATGPLAYMARPQKPKELYALYPFKDSLKDLSIYQRDLSASVSYQTNGIWDMEVGSFTINIGNLSEYTIDFFLCLKNTGDTATFLTSQEWKLTLSGWSNFNILNKNNGSICSVSANANTILHIAIAQKDGVLYSWINGTFKGSYGSGLQALTALNLNNKGAFCNMRIVSKCLQTSGTCPVPGTYYTGYEPLNGGG